MTDKTPQPLSPQYSAPQKEDKRKIWRRISIRFSIVIILFSFWWIGTHGDQENPIHNQKEADSVQNAPKKGFLSLGQDKRPKKTIEESGAFSLQEKNTGACRGLIPTD